MKIQLDTPRAKIAAASSFVVIGSVIGAAIHFASSNTGKKQVTVQVEEVREARKPPTREELDDAQSSWLFTSSESVSLVDHSSGFETATIGN